MAEIEKEVVEVKPKEPFDYDSWYRIGADADNLTGLWGNKGGHSQQLDLDDKTLQSQ